MARAKEPRAEAAAREIAENCLAVRLRAVNRSVTSVYDDALRPLQLKASQLNVLVAIANLGAAQPANVARLLHLEKSTLSRNVDKMRTRGWIELRETDGRGHELHLTAKGNDVVARALPRWREAQKKTKAMLGAGAVQALKSIHRGLPSD